LIGGPKKLVTFSLLKFLNYVITKNAQKLSFLVEVPNF